MHVQESGTVSVPLQIAVEALADVLVDYDVPTGRILAEFKQTIAVYAEAE